MTRQMNRKQMISKTNEREPVYGTLASGIDDVIGGSNDDLISVPSGLCSDSQSR